MKSKLLSLTLTLVLAGLARADFNPVPLTQNSFTYGIVVSSNAPQGPNGIANTVTATVGGGTGEGDYTFCEQGWMYPRPSTGWNCGIPEHNTLLTNINNSHMIFLMPPTYATNNVLMVIAPNSNGRGDIPGGTFTLNTPTSAVNLAFLCMDGNGAQTISYTVTHADSSTDAGTLSMLDWFTGGSTIAWGANGRIGINTAGAPNNSGNDQNYNSSSANTHNPYLYAITIPIAHSSPITSILFNNPVNAGPVCNFFAVSGSPDGVNYSPLPVSGFNEMAVIPAYVPYPVTATMDNGTNIGSLSVSGGADGNTWYEQGYNTASLTTGLPPSGSTFTSISEPTHHYQMGNYNSNNAVLIDAHHLSNNIVPANPQAYTAFAFLTAGANDNGAPGYMLNECILQHTGGISETNYFKGYDWFNGSVAAAWTAGGRVSMGYCPVAYTGFNDVGSTTSPNLFETYFSLSDSVDPVTNIVVLYYQAPGNNSTTYIMAVSATAGGIAPLVTGPLPTNQVWFAGQTATFTATVSGTAPITNIWQVESNGVFYTLSDGLDANGSTIYGSQTTTLVISNLAEADGTNYQFIATNALGGAIGLTDTLVVSNDSFATPVVIVAQVPPASVSSLAVFTNLPAPFSVTVTNTASPPVTYQWYTGVPQTPANAIPGATNAGYVLSNLDGVTLSCIVSNFLGAVTSSPVAITLKSPLSSPAPYQAALIGYHPVAYWPLNEPSGTVAYDLVGNNDGIYVGSCTLGQPGVTGASSLGTNLSVSFDGFSSYVDIQVNQLAITGPVSVIQWVETTGESANTDTGDGHFSTTLSRGGSGYRLAVDGTGNPHFADPAPDATGAASIANGAWHQLVGVYDGTNEYNYVDGSLVAQQLVVTFPTANGSDVWIGGDPDYGTQATDLNGLNRIFYGNICQVAILTNVLSASQVTALYYAAGAAPAIETDLLPQNYVFDGFPLVLSVTASGTPPLSYQWTSNSVNLVDGGRITGSQSNVLTIADTTTNDSAVYQVIVSNNTGSTPSTASTVTVLPVLQFNGDGLGWSLNKSLAANGYQGDANTLQLTTGAGGEVTSSFFDFPVYVGGFIATFNYQDVSLNGADGMAFVVQNDPRGATAVGGGGGDFGFAGASGTGIAPSVGAELNIYGGNANTYGFQTSPTATGPFSSTSPVLADNGDLINVTITYLAGTMTMTLVDSATADTFTANYSVNIPTVLGTNMAYVGFTGADGGVAAKQQVSDFQYVPIVSLSVASGSGNNLVFNWPTAIGAYVLEQTSSLDTPNWVPATATYSVGGGVNQATVPASGAGNFYRLHLTY